MIAPIQLISKARKDVAPLVYYILLTILLFSGCTTVMPTEQLILGREDAVLSQQEGKCDDSIPSESAESAAFSREVFDPSRITLVSWNLYKGQRANWENDLLMLGAEKDIILLQEASLNLPLKAAMEQLSLHWSLNNAFRFNGRETGVMMASRIQPLYLCGMRHNEPLTGISKTILISQYPIERTEEKLLVANIHSINFTLGLGAYQDQLSSLIAIAEQHHGPLIIAGDFNNWSQGREERINNLVKQLALSKIEFVPETRTTFFGEPVDHIFYRGLELLSAEVRQVFSSDHYPIIVAFSLPSHLLQTENKR